MRCNRAVEILRSISDMKETNIEPKMIRELIGLKLVDEAETADLKGWSEDKLNELKKQLAILKDDRRRAEEDLKKMSSRSSSIIPRSLFRKDSVYKTRVQELEANEKKEREVRALILELVQNSTEMRYNALVNDKPMILTYKGKEALVTMEQRGRRISKHDLSDFLSEIDATREHFSERAKRANKILKKISPSYPSIDEIHLRMISVGLSGRKGTISQVTNLFKEAMDILEPPSGLTGSTEMVLAETLVLSSSDKHDLKKRSLEANKLLLQPFHGYATSQDQTRAIGIICSHGGNVNGLAFKIRKLADEVCPKMYSPAALVACSEGRLAEKIFRSMVTKRTLGGSEPEHVMASAIIAISGLTPDVVHDSYRDALAKIQNLGLKNMEITAAMLSVLPYDVEETLDNLRMSSQAISLNKLSLGAVENISLGMKMLMTSSVISTGLAIKGDGGKLAMGELVADAPVHLALEGMLVLNALTMTASMNAFHEVSLHRVAVSDYRFHPVHSHYVYG